MATIELKSAASINWSALLDQVRIDYETAPAKGLAHGLQKEALQNGWGARRTERGAGWGFSFTLTPSVSGHRFLAMTDWGTFGLTGDVSFDAAGLPENAPIPAEQRWARFEGVYESGGEGIGPGSFGRGKFIFNLASAERLIYYDSLTTDGEYRIGMRRIKGRDYQQLKHVLTGADAERYLETVTAGQLARLKAPGTRIIVVDPIAEVVESLENGDFMRAIGETWWEIIQKYSAEIAVQLLPAAEAQATIPPDFGGFLDKGVKGWKVYRRDNVPLVIDGIHHRIKRLHFLIAPASHGHSSRASWSNHPPSRDGDRPGKTQRNP